MAKKREVNLELALAMRVQDDQGRLLMWCSRGDNDLRVHWLSDDGAEQTSVFPDSPEGIIAFDKEITKAMARAWELGTESATEEPIEVNVKQISLDEDQIWRMYAAADRGWSKSDVWNHVSPLVAQEEDFEEVWKSIRERRKLEREARKTREENGQD